jgi:phage tail-like protein
MGASEFYPPPAFHFKLTFSLAPGADTAFQEVDGIGSELDTQEFVEGGEHRFVHRLPLGVKHPLLRLKRGIAKFNSPLVHWCKSVLEANFAKRIVTQDVLVFLLDENQIPLRGWSFANVYPVKWEIDTFHSTKNEVAIETIALSYTASSRIV